MLWRDGRRAVLAWLILGLLAACSGRPTSAPAPTAVPGPAPNQAPRQAPAETPRQAAAATAEATATQPAAASPVPAAVATAPAAAPASPSAPPASITVKEPARYRRLPAPLVNRSAEKAISFLANGAGMQSGSYHLQYDGKRVLIGADKGDVALALTLPGGDELNLLGAGPAVEKHETADGLQLVLSGQGTWTRGFRATLYTYAYHPGLFRWRLEVVPNATAAPAAPAPELQFVQRATGAETSGGLDAYAEHVPMAAPQFYAYSAGLDSTLFYWVDLTALNPFMAAAHYTPSATPALQGNRLGHAFTSADLSRQAPNTATVLYDSYLYLVPGKPADEDAMFTRYLQNLGDVYDLMAVPDDPLPDWFGFYEWNGQGAPQGVQSLTMRDLANDQNWVTLNGKRYLRAYYADTRQSAELISQLDVYEGLARYRQRFGDVPAYFQDLRAVIPDFFNPDAGPAGMLQNPGPLAAAGPAKQGDTWYELGHALKVAELALADPKDAQLRDLAVRSGQTWIAFAHAVQYKFPQAYTLGTWHGSGREPDTAGAYAYFMLLLRDLAAQPGSAVSGPGPNSYLDEARQALHALDGYGFRLAYETHMTALTAAAAARMYQVEPDALYLRIINRAAANLLRLSWAWECDYGFWQDSKPSPLPQMPFALAGPLPNHTFFGLNPTQASAVVTPKEQYEAWIYVNETLQRAHGKLDPTVEKLLAEFSKHTLLTIPHSLPPLMPPGAATAHPAAYDTVKENNLSLYIPLEDMRDGWDVSGAIGQEVYGAGMAPTLAALALVELAPDLELYSSYPLAGHAGDRITFAGMAGAYGPAAVIGARAMVDGQGRPVATAACGKALCFQAQGGSTYGLQR